MDRNYEMFVPPCKEMVRLVLIIEYKELPTRQGIDQLSFKNNLPGP